MSVKKEWPAKALQCLKTSSCVNLEGEHIDDLSRLGQPRMMRQLNLSYVQLPSIEGLKPLPNLETFIADGSQISSLANFSAISGIRKLSLRQTPVSRDPQFALSVLLVCPALTSLNGRQISEIARTRAERYPDIGRRLVDNGWMAEWPAPDDDKFAELCVEFGVQEVDAVEPGADEEEDGEEVDRFEEVVAAYHRQHRLLVRRTKKRLELLDDEEEEEEDVIEEEEEEEEASEQSNATDTKLEDFHYVEAEEDDLEPTLVQKLVEILKENNVEIDENDQYNSVLEAIEALCEAKDEQKRTELEQQSDASEDSAGKE